MQYNVQELIAGAPVIYIQYIDFTSQQKKLDKMLPRPSAKSNIYLNMSINRQINTKIECKNIGKLVRKHNMVLLLASLCGFL